MATDDVATANGTAAQPDDYASNSGSLDFAPGEASKSVTVLVNGDVAVEPDETYFVNLTNAGGGATIADAQGLCTILNDDAACAPNVRTLSNGDPTSAVGALRLPVVGLGAAGDDATGSALYNPPGDLPAK